MHVFCNWPVKFMACIQWEPGFFIIGVGDYTKLYKNKSWKDSWSNGIEFVLWRFRKQINQKIRRTFLLEVSFITTEHYEIKTKENDRAGFYVKIMFFILILIWLFCNSFFLVSYNTASYDPPKMLGLYEVLKIPKSSP